MTMQLAHPGYLWLFLLFIPLIAWYVWKHRTAYPSLHISTVNSFRMAKRPLRYYGLIGMFVLRMAALACLIIVLARPQTRDAWHTSRTEGTDMVIALDISSSMLARDLRRQRRLQPTLLTVANLTIWDLWFSQAKRLPAYP